MSQEKHCSIPASPGCPCSSIYNCELWLLPHIGYWGSAKALIWNLSWKASTFKQITNISFVVFLIYTVINSNEMCCYVMLCWHTQLTKRDNRKLIDSSHLLWGGGIYRRLAGAEGAWLCQFCSCTERLYVILRFPWIIHRLSIGHWSIHSICLHQIWDLLINLGNHIGATREPKTKKSCIQLWWCNTALLDAVFHFWQGLHRSCTLFIMQTVIPLCSYTGSVTLHSVLIMSLYGRRISGCRACDISNSHSRRGERRSVQGLLSLFAFSRQVVNK